MYRIVLCLLVGLMACGGGDGDAPRRDQSQRERDSTIGASRLPGARGVQGALEAADTAANRRRIADSIAAAN